MQSPLKGLKIFVEYMSNFFDLVHKKTEPSAETAETAVAPETVETVETNGAEKFDNLKKKIAEINDKVDLVIAAMEEETTTEKGKKTTEEVVAEPSETVETAVEPEPTEKVEPETEETATATECTAEETVTATECVAEESTAATAITAEETPTVSEPETTTVSEPTTAADGEPTADGEPAEVLDAQYKQIRFSNTAAKIDLDCTLPTVTSSEILTKAEQAKKYGFASVCILASRMKIFKKQAKEQAFCAVIAYPSGEMTEKSKLCEIKEATSNGASEIDVFFRISALKDEKRKQIVRSLVKYGKAIGKKRVYKLSFDCGMASEEEARFIVSAAAQAKVDYLVIRNCAKNDVRTQLFYAGLCAGRCKLEFSDNASDLSSITRLSDIGTGRFLLTDAFEIADRIKQEIEDSAE